MHAFAFTSSEQVTSVTDGSLEDLMRDGLAGAGVYLIPFGRLETTSSTLPADRSRSERPPISKAFACAVLVNTVDTQRVFAND
jgi:hypothetical protein